MNRTLQNTRTIALAILLVGVGGAAFRLSYDAQVKLAIVAGVTRNLAGLYPLVVDAVILLTTLIAIWNRPDRKGGRIYIWIALAVWTATSVLGNAFHVVALPAGQVEIPIGAAIAVNTVPALSLFVAIHLATTMAFRRPAIVAKPRTTRTTAPRVTTETSFGFNQVTDERLLAMADEQHLSVRAIALELGMGKTAVANRLAKIREQEQLAS